ncbi:CTC-interacting domain 4 isoform X2 [Carex rostrata]
MSNQQVVAPRASSNGFGPRRSERDNKPHSSAKSSGTVNGGKLTHASPSHDRLMYVITYLTGLPVEVHVKNGSVISGIFHAANTDKDFGVVLKMAQITKGSSARGQKSQSEVVKKPETMVIPSRVVVQIVAKDVALTIDELMSAGNASEKKKDLLIDSVISQSRHVEERELERWAPDGDESDCLELETMYGGRKWSRNWDQFETNEVLFGVKSTFNEEIYTTKLVKGPHMKDLEMRASKLAREIEGEDTDDLHLAEERGINFLDNVDIDEELRYSAVVRDNWRGREVQSDSWRSRESQTDSWRRPTETQSDSWRSHHETQDESGEALGSAIIDTPLDLSTSSSVDVDYTDFGSMLTSDSVENKSVTIDENARSEEKKIKDDSEKCTDNAIPDIKPSDDEKASASEDVKKNKSCKTSEHEPFDSFSSGKAGPTTEPPNTWSARPGSSTSNASERVGGLSRTSSVASLASDKSSLNPNAKEFKLNPNARIFMPNLRPQAPAVPDTSFYYQPNVAPVQHMHTVPMAMGMGAPFGAPQQFVYNPQAGVPLQQAYVPPNAPPVQYGQQMMMGQPQPRPVYFMQTYTPPEMQFRGRNF